MPKWPKLTEEIVRSQPMPTSTEMSPLIDNLGGSSGRHGGTVGGINGDIVTEEDVQNALAQAPPSIAKHLGNRVDKIYAFIVCHSKLPVPDDTLVVDNVELPVGEWAQGLLKVQAKNDTPMSEKVRAAFRQIPMWPVFESTAVMPNNVAGI